MMEPETLFTLLLSVGVLGVFLLGCGCDAWDTHRLRLRWRRSAFLCRQCQRVYGATLRPGKQREAPCPYCGTDNTPLHF